MKLDKIIILIYSSLGILLITTKLSQVTAFKHKKLHLSGFIPIDTSVSGGYSAAGMLAALDLGFAEINNSSQVLPDYKLEITWNDTHCLAGYSTSIFMREIAKKPTKIMLVGDGCSMSTQPIAEACPYYNLIMVSYIAASPVLSDKSRYKTFFRMAMPDSSYNGPRIAVMRHFNWSRIATIHQTENSNYFSLMTQDLLVRLKLNNINHSIVAVESFQDDPKLQVENLKRKDARVIVLNMYSSKARLVFCWAYKLGFLNGSIERVWFIPGFYSPNWWNKTDTTCTAKELKSAINHVLLTDTINLRTDGKRAISGVTISEYVENLQRWPLANKHKPSPYHPYGYDTAWAVALTLNSTLNIMKANPQKYQNKSLEDFSYTDSDMLELMKEQMFALHFEGVTGTVKFTATGDRTGTLTVLQRINDTRNLIGIYDGINKKLNYIGGSPKFYWKNEKVPTDGSYIISIITPLEVNFSAAIIIATISVLGIPFSLIILGINNKYRHVRSIKVSSPTVNIFICVGAVLMYIANIAYSIFQAIKYQSVNPSVIIVFCEIWKWFLPIGFTLSMGAIASKAFRIYVIYASVQGKPRRRKISDKSLMKLIGIFLLIDIIILSLWSIIDPLRMTTTVVERKVSTTNPDITYIKQIYYCSSSYLAYWMLVLGTKETILLLFGIVVAYGTRNVAYKDLNDARLVITIVYNFAVTVVITGPLRFALDAIIPTVYFIIDSCVIWISITVMLSIIFLPKFCRMHHHHKIKDGTNDGTNGTSKSQSKDFESASRGTSINPRQKRAPLAHLDG